MVAILKITKKIFNLICILIFIFYLINSLKFDENGIPKGKLYKTLQFENVEIKILGNDGNATGGGFLRVEFVNDEGKSKLLFFDSESIPSETIVKYIDKNTINVNGKNIKLNEIVIIR